MEELSLKESAEILGTSIAAVKARQFHGRRMLRKRMTPVNLSGMRSTAGVAARY
jgi:DNA-directed RNA polymerase specialized sigma24 family protein